MVCLRKGFSIPRKTASPGKSLLSMKRFIEGFGHSTDSQSLPMCGNRRTARGKLLNSDWNWLIRVVRYFVTKPDLEPTRVIPPQGNWKFWKRDQGRCVVCQAEDNLHFDHELPYSKSGTRRTARNIRLPSARHNLEKSDRIEWSHPPLRFRLCPRESRAQRTVAALAATFASNSCGSVA
jgi:hypothetical protein